LISQKRIRWPAPQIQCSQEPIADQEYALDTVAEQSNHERRRTQARDRQGNQDIGGFLQPFRPCWDLADAE